MIVEASGRLAANREVVLAAEVGGVVAEYQAEVGDSVEKGQVLVLIDPMDYQLALNEAKAGMASAQAQLEAARNTYVRSKNLLPRKVISQESFERAEAEYKAARASVSRAKALVDIAEQRLAKTKITAPFSGLISARTVELGQTLAPGTPVMGVVDLAEMRVKVYVAERDYVDLDPADPVSVIVEAYSDRTFKGRIDLIGVKADPQTSTFAVEVLVDNPELVLKAGLSARVKIVSKIIKDAILIPQSTVLYREDRREVFVVGEDNTAQTRRVTLGRNRDSDIEILDGLKPGDELIVMGGAVSEIRQPGGHPIGMKILRYIISHARIFTLLVVLVPIVAGVYAYNTLPKEGEPEISAPLAIVVTAYTGASPGEIESLVTNPLEEALSDLKDLKELRSSSLEGVSVVVVEFAVDADVERSIQRVREKVTDSRGDLPDEAEDPDVEEITLSDIPIMLISVVGDLDPMKLKRLAEKTADELELLPEVLSTDVAGGLTREIQIYADPVRLNQYGLTILDVYGAVGQSDINIPGGMVNVAERRFLLRTLTEVKRVEDYAPYSHCEPGRPGGVPGRRGRNRGRP